MHSHLLNSAEEVVVAYSKVPLRFPGGIGEKYERGQSG